MLKHMIDAIELENSQGKIRCPSIIFLELRSLMFKASLSWAFPFLKGKQVYLGGGELCIQMVEAIATPLNVVRMVTKFCKRVIFG